LFDGLTQTAFSLQLLKPDAVFLLGDLLDEGKYCTDDEWDATMERYRTIFYAPEEVNGLPHFRWMHTGD
jgi:hypothetical protein